MPEEKKSFLSDEEVVVGKSFLSDEEVSLTQPEKKNTQQNQKPVLVGSKPLPQGGGLSPFISKPKEEKPKGFAEVGAAELEKQGVVQPPPEMRIEPTIDPNVTQQLREQKTQEDIARETKVDTKRNEYNFVKAFKSGVDDFKRAEDIFTDLIAVDVTGDPTPFINRMEQEYAEYQKRGVVNKYEETPAAYVANLFGNQAITIAGALGTSALLSPIVGIAYGGIAAGSQSAGATFEQDYYELRDKGLSPEEAYKQAYELAQTSLGFGAIEGTAGAIVPAGKLATGVKEATKQVAKDALFDVSIATIAQGAQNEIEANKGLSRELTDGMVENATGEAVFSIIMGSFVKRREVLKNKPKVLYELSQAPEEVIQADLEARVENGVATPEEAEAAMQDIIQYKGKLTKVPDNFTDEQKQKSVELITQRDDLQASIEGKDEALVKPQKEQIELINTQLEQIANEPITRDEDRGTDAVEKSVGEQPSISETGVEEAVTEEVVPEQVKISETKPSDVFILNGEKGNIVTLLNENMIVFETQDKVIDLGTPQDISDLDISEFGIEKESLLDIETSDDYSVTIDGKRYVNNYSDPQAAINYDENGDVVSINLETEDGKKRTIRGDRANTIAYQYKLKQFEENATEESIARLENEVEQLEVKVEPTKSKTKGTGVRKGKQKPQNIAPQKSQAKTQQEAQEKYANEKPSPKKMDVGEQARDGEEMGERNPQEEITQEGEEKIAVEPSAVEKGQVSGEVTTEPDALKDIEATAKALEGVDVVQYLRDKTNSLRDEQGNIPKDKMEEFKALRKASGAVNDGLVQIPESAYENTGRSKKFTPQQISEAYHKAKADGSNPELVKAVEELLGTPQKVEASTKPTVTKEQALESRAKPQLEPEVKSNLEKIQEETGTNFREIQNVYTKYGEGKPLNEITVEDYRAAEAKRQEAKEPTENKIADVAQKAGITPKNLRDLYKINRELFGLDRIKSIAAAIAMDRMVGVMAKRANITKAEMFARLKFEKASEQNLPQGVKFQVAAWHGSPHQFDKFSLEKIGTGEGAQAFGWGLYFTDLKSIAKNYAEKLSSTVMPSDISIDGETLTDKLKESDIDPSLIRYDVRVKNKKQLVDDFSSKVEVLKEIVSKNQSIVSQYEKNNGIVDGVKLKEESYNIFKKRVQSAKKELDAYTKSLSIIKDSTNVEVNKKGKNIYKVSLHKGKTPDQYTWLEWDMPVSKELLDKIAKQLATDDNTRKVGERKGTFNDFSARWKDSENKYAAYKNYKNGEVYEQLAKVFGAKDASLLLLRAGIDGIKYPAESISRGATIDTARGFNYVVFDENAVSIEEVIKFQKDAEKARGAAMVTMDGTAIIYALTDPNVSTPLHEMAHVFEHYMTDAEKAIVQSWAGTKGWTIETSEKLARGFEKYLAEGKAPNSSLQKIFDKFKTWLTDIYNGITGSDIDIELNEPMREIYAQMLGADAVKTQKLKSAPKVVTSETIKKTVPEKTIEAVKALTRAKKAMTETARTKVEETAKDAPNFDKAKYIMDNLENIKAKLLESGKLTTDCKWG